MTPFMILAGTATAALIAATFGATLAGLERLTRARGRRMARRADARHWPDM
jgi:hypothetical protein